MQIKSTFEDSEIQQSISHLVALGQDLRPVTRAVAAVLASESETAFDTETDPNTGERWQPLSERYKKKLAAHGKTGKMLQRSMAGLAMSLQTDFDAVSAVIGSNKIYAAIQLWGGLPDMPPGPAAVPARGYMGLSPDSITQILEIINRKHTEAITGKRQG